MDTLIIPGPPGLTTPDFSFELYLDGVQQADPGLSVSEVGSNVDATLYLVSGRPEGEQGEFWTLTWEMPGGYSGAHRWPLQFTTPPNLVLPFRAAGLSIADVSPILLLDGVSVSTSGLSLSYESPDYVLEGIEAPGDSGDQFHLSLSYLGFTQGFTWPSLLGSLPALSSTNPRTIERRLLGRYFIDNWLGPDEDQTTYCAAAYQGQDFDPDVESDCSPFTPDQVRNDVGYVLLTFQEINRVDAGVVSGVSRIEGQDIVHRQFRTVTNLEFEIRVPSGADDPKAISETYQERLEEIFLGLYIRHEGPPLVTLRQRTVTPPRTRGGLDDQTWYRSYLDVQFERRENRPHAGKQEVALP